MDQSPLISMDKCQGYLGSPDYVIVDCRFDLKNPDWGYQDYLRSHIPNAVYAHLNNDLSSKIRPDTGRHPLPDETTFSHTLSKLSLTPDKTIIAYDTNGSSFAARLWWMLSSIGYTNVYLLDGDFSLWENEHRPVQNGPFSLPPLPIRPISFDRNRFVSSDQMESLFKDSEYLIIDARAPERYRGETEPIDHTAGHVPGAVNRFHSLNLDSSGKFKSAGDLKREFTSLLGNYCPDHVIVYCGSGVTSCHHLAAMQVAGMPGARLYVGSWSEWIQDSSRPIATIER